MSKRMPEEDRPFRLAVQVHPGAKRNEVLRLQEGVWHLKIAAPPVEGKANKELLSFLSELLGISKGRLSIEKGATGHKKLIAVQGLTPSIVEERMGKDVPKMFL